MTNVNTRVGVGLWGVWGFWGLRGACLLSCVCSLAPARARALARARARVRVCARMVVISSPAGSVARINAETFMVDRFWKSKYDNDTAVSIKKQIGFRFDG